MRQVSAFTIDLSNIEGDGAFSCPSCGTLISPDDESEDTYEIVDIKTKKDDSIETLSIHCKKCGSTIRLEGFELLRELGNVDDVEEPEEY